MSTPSPVAANHHADYPGFSGAMGLVAALSMTVGRGDTASLAADLTGVTPADRVVDVGCGPGTAARQAARRGARVIGVDPAPVMLRVARLLTRGTSIEWRQAAAEALPFEDESATVVWSLSTVHHWADVGRGLAEAHRVLMPGGRFLASERKVHAGATGHASHGWRPEQADAFAEACRAAGFVDVVVETHRPGGRATMVVRAKR